MDPDLENVIRQALGDALAAGKDHLGQTELAVQAVQRARPDMTASDALAAVYGKPLPYGEFMESPVNPCKLVAPRYLSARSDNRFWRQ